MRSYPDPDEGGEARRDSYEDEDAMFARFHSDLIKLVALYERHASHLISDETMLNFKVITIQWA